MFTSAWWDAREGWRVHETNSLIPLIPFYSFEEQLRVGWAEGMAKLELLDGRPLALAPQKGIQSLHTLHASGTQLVIFAESSTAETFWAPSIASNASEHASFWGIGTNGSVLVGGPYLVRSAHIGSDTLALHGDPNASSVEKESRLTIIAPRSVTKVTWNEEIVLLDDSSVDDRYITGTIELAEKAEITVPELDGWKYHDSLPEIGDEFGDSQWAVANHTGTNVPFKMWYGDGRVLYGWDYGYCEGAVIWRGHFNATGAEKSMNLSINGGQGFAATVSSNGANNINGTDQVFTFSDGSVRLGQDNVVTVVQDNMGLNKNWYTDDHMKLPRAIRSFQLNSGNFSEWKVQGKIGGYTNFPDKVRGVMNEGGLFGEHKGWHLPDFDTSSWKNQSLSDGLPNAAAGVGFSITKFKLSIPGGYDVPISFNFDEPFGQAYRALLFVNGWNMGKRIRNFGPQAKFPVHEGIVNHQGEK
ncbi:glycoside hydrolase family 35 protein [Moniliophthora roreri MCA 2997]|uniref:Glycoside hydrolase family 35 protein n=1 Tax=Moniliophthora roreri (strain MCA 2997) TaxID=1381753 RepID=V2XS90_MONRO|nr:glycoside hydrolase family 35 protein [Moniliophthora roreri MCA 2997]